MTKQHCKQLDSYLEQNKYEELLNFLENCIKHDPENLEYYSYLSLVYLLHGQQNECQSLWISILLQLSIEQAECWKQNLIVFLESKVKKYLQEEQLESAKSIYESIVFVDQEYSNYELLNMLLDSLSKLANGLVYSKHYKMAIDVYQEILSLTPDDVQSLHSLALANYNIENYSEAKKIIEKAINLDNSNAENFYGLGLIYEKLSDQLSAIDKYYQAIERDINLIDCYYKLGDLYAQNAMNHKALETYSKALNKFGSRYYPEIFYRIGTIQNDEETDRFLGYAAHFSQDNDTAIKHFEKYLQYNTEDIQICLDLARAYVRTNQTSLAITFIKKKLSLFPDNLSLQVLDQSILPIIYQDTKEIEYYRARFINLLTQLITCDRPMTIEEVDQISQGIDRKANFYLAYQGKNDVNIQKQYSDYVHYLLGIKYPQWCRVKFLDSDIANRKIRIGFVSCHLYGLGKLYLGWLKFCNQSKFEFYVYDLFSVDEKNSSKLKSDFKRYSQNIWCAHPDTRLPDVCERIISDQLDILIFPEIGLDPVITPLSCLRLAPIQCTTWAHPVTSGSPTIDYFLSSALMEPDNGDEHYSETLVRLPNIGFAISSPELPLPNKQRSDFGLGEDSIVYWCCQSLFKYLPQHDYIFPSIAQQNHQCQFIFLDSYHGPTITKYFQQRIDKIFSEFGLDYTKYCVFLPKLINADFIRICQLADVFLDCLSWSGGITTIEAITCGLPIVTCPGGLMRARHSYGLLLMLGITETIAQTESEYIRIAVRLGLDFQWRQNIREKILANNHRILEDQACIAALESFFLQVTNPKVN